MNFLEHILKTTSAYFQHGATIRQLMTAPPAERGAALANYVRGLSDASFLGFKMMMLGAVNEEQNSERKAILHALFQNLEKVRSGAPLGEMPVIASPAASAEPLAAAAMPAPAGDSFDSDLALLNKLWVNNTNADEKRTKLVDHLITLDGARYQRFMGNLQQMQANQQQNIKTHKANELNAWGGYFEDRMAYFAARERTGQKDPKFMKALRELESGLADINWVIESSAQFWPLIQKKRQRSPTAAKQTQLPQTG